MVLFSVAEAIEAKSLARAREAIGGLVNLAPEKATVRNDRGIWAEMEAAEVPVGSVVRVRPGERIALDGIIVKGSSAVNQAPITGESLPVDKGQGDQVFAGTINEAGSFEFQVSSPFANSTLARIIRAVEEAQSTRAPIQRFVDNFARVYTPIVFVAAVLVGVLPPLFGGAWLEWIYRALVLLVIACPCALVISTPVTIVSALAAATRHGLLIKGGAFLEEGRKLNWLLFDKTGTITTGRPVRTDLIVLNQANSSQAHEAAFSLASRSDHPVSKAVAQGAISDGQNQVLEVEDFQAKPGLGVSGRIGGYLWNLGNLKYMKESGIDVETIEGQVGDLEKQGKSVVGIFGNDGPVILFAVADQIKNGAAKTIAELKSLGLKTMMLSGDNQQTVEAVGQEVGLDEPRGDLLPADKLETVAKLSQKGFKVGMVGDGINDAPALARADIGFAMASAGTGAAIETADVAIMDDDLAKLPVFIRLSRSSYGILMQNISLAIGIKLLFFVLTFMGHTSMWMAVFADIGVSLIVVFNGMRMLRK